jgi:hypothetical protein
MSGPHQGEASKVHYEESGGVYHLFIYYLTKHVIRWDGSTGQDGCGQLELKTS